MERSDVQRELACTDSRLRDMKYACQRVVAAIDGAAKWQVTGDGLAILGDTGAFETSRDADAVSVEKLVRALKDRKELKTRLSEIDEFLGKCGL